jgi:RuvA, C-terminal domain
MKTHSHSPRTNSIAALLLIVAAIFLRTGAHTGVLGALVSATAVRLVGDTGVALLTFTAFSIAFILATPPGTFTRMIAALWHAVKPRHSAAVVVVKTSRGGGVDAGLEATVSAPAPRDRRELQTVRDALKGLGYAKTEYEPLIARMDPTAGFEKLVKNALRALRVN